MKPAVVVDTNVPIVANVRAGADPACALACVQELRETTRQRRLLLDRGGLILKEYRQHLSPNGQPGAGDAFFKWAWDNQANPKFCRSVKITPVAPGGKGFDEFPSDLALESFDHSDRKFVAVVVAGGKTAEILNASDIDWWNARKPLRRNGITVRFLCPQLMNVNAVP